MNAKSAQLHRCEGGSASCFLMHPYGTSHENLNTWVFELRKMWEPLDSRKGEKQFRVPENLLLKSPSRLQNNEQIGSFFLIPSIVFNLPQVTLIYQTLCEQKHWGRQLSSLSFYSRACTEPLDVALKCRALGLQRHGHSLLPQLSACLGIAS